MQLPIGSLPLHFRRTREAFPDHHGYLRADPARVAAWRERLAALGRASKDRNFMARRHAQIAAACAFAAACPGCRPILLVIIHAHFIDLQYMDFSAEIAELRGTTGVQVHSWDEVRADYEETAALVACARLGDHCVYRRHPPGRSGALGGKLVGVMAPFSPEWRYGIAGEKMPWYPSVRVFRQPAFGEWDAVIESVAETLADLTRVRAPS